MASPADTSAEAEGDGPAGAAGASDDGAANPTGSQGSVAGLPDATMGQRSAPPDGTGTALLREVRTGRHDGFDRIVFEFSGASVPGYRMEWVDGPITSDGSGEPIEVRGEARLAMVLSPASGVDVSGPEFEVIYAGPDRIAVAEQTAALTDLVRTSDFEAVLTWVAGADAPAPFRVQTLSSPTRIVVDLAS
jgi:hypothetical protein